MFFRENATILLSKCTMVICMYLLLDPLSGKKKHLHFRNCYITLLFLFKVLLKVHFVVQKNSDICHKFTFSLTRFFWKIAKIVSKIISAPGNNSFRVENSWTKCAKTPLFFPPFRPCLHWQKFWTMAGEAVDWRGSPSSVRISASVNRA